ncbi:hypothetical protein Q8G48_28130, partial [Klebsiella pneumoniae]|uniref:hypothetical protein n=1 Tax=Klebsiella pneumoniae TaxID=573 RepID=UPI0030139FD0
ENDKLACHRFSLSKLDYVIALLSFFSMFLTSAIVASTLYKPGHANNNLWIRIISFATSLIDCT